MSELFRFQSSEGERPRAVVVAVRLQGVDVAEFDSSLRELERLATTLGVEVLGRVTQLRSRMAPGKVLGDGKLKELALWTGGTGEVEAYKKPGAKRKSEIEAAEQAELRAAANAAASARQVADADPDADADADADAEVPGLDDGDEADDADKADDKSTVIGGPPPGTPQAEVILVDHDLTPTQQRNLERATGVDVLDRTSVILEIFQRHAKTREARLQVEIARLKYLAPRLRESGGGEDRVRGGVGGKGAGESSLELDRRRIRDRIAELRHELSQIEGNSKIRRGRRGELPTVALVGYTNAGKSSLMRALTGSEVYVADKLFATLDTTVRVLHPKTQPPVLVSDTVGFIKKLPHDLVASFRSTLEEAAEADLLLHVVDASDAAFRDHITVTHEVLGEIGVEADSLVILNKIDKVDADERARLVEAMPDAWPMSAKSPADVLALHDRIVAHFEGELEDAELHVPWAQHRLVHTIHENARVLAEDHNESGTSLTVRAPSRTLARLRAELVE